jgi:hypothetical protein
MISRAAPEVVRQCSTMNLIGTCATNRVTGSRNWNVKGRAFWIGLFVACNIGVGLGAIAAQPAGPPAGYNIDEEFTQKSPDGATTIEQYQNKSDWTWQFWLRRAGAATRLDQGPEPAGYPADFVFTSDVKWIVRAQKIGSGISTLHLYRLTPEGYVLASEDPLGELAWDYMKTRSDWRKIAEGAGVSRLGLSAGRF